MAYRVAQVREKIGADVMETLKAGIGKEVSVSYVLFGRLEEQTGKLVGVVDFGHISVKLTDGEKTHLAQYPFIGLNTQVRTVFVEGVVAYDNTVNVSENEVVKTQEKSRELRVKTFGADVIDAIAAPPRKPEEDTASGPKGAVRRLLGRVKR